MIFFFLKHPAKIAPAEASLSASGGALPANSQRYYGGKRRSIIISFRHDALIYLRRWNCQAIKQFEASDSTIPVNLRIEDGEKFLPECQNTFLPQNAQ